MRENRTRYGADEEELEAITREIHAQLRALYGEPGPGCASIEHVPMPDAPVRASASAELLRFALALLLPPLAMAALGLVLGLVKDGF